MVYCPRVVIIFASVQQNLWQANPINLMTYDNIVIFILLLPLGILLFNSILAITKIKRTYKIDIPNRILGRAR